MRPARDRTSPRNPPKEKPVPKVLNVGGNSKKIPLPPFYAGWEHVLLDIDPRGGPDVVCDARTLGNLPAAGYESVYCSHNLEHYFHHEAQQVLKGFAHVLKPEGFAFIRVPDMHELMATVVERKLDIDDVLYQSPAGPIMVRDVIYGYGVEIERSGNPYYAHKTGFTRSSLIKVLRANGFPIVFAGVGSLEIQAYAFKQPPSEALARQLRLPGHQAATAG
jgi:SAM-dependent methyltransferase